MKKSQKYTATSIVLESHPSGAWMVVEQHLCRPDVPTSIFLLTHKGSPHTIENFAYTLCKFVNSVVESKSVNCDWRNLNDHHLQNYHIALAKTLRTSSLSVEVSRLKTFFDWAWESGWLDRPFIYDWKLQHSVSRQLIADKVLDPNHNLEDKDPFGLYGQYIPEDDFNLALMYLPRKSIWERIRDDIVMRLGYYSGMRAAETTDPTNIGLKHIQNSIKRANERGLTGFELKIIGKGKNGGKPRTVYIRPEERRLIEHYMRNELKRQTPKATLLIGKRNGESTTVLSKKHSTLLFREIAKKLLIEGGREETRAWRENEVYRSFHSLRHSYATNFAADRVNIGLDPIDLLMERMGHRHRTTTQIYLWFAAKRAGDNQTANKYVSSLDAHENWHREYDDEL